MIHTMHNVATGNEQEVKDYYSKCRHDVKVHNRDFSMRTKVLVFAPIVTGRCSDKLMDRWQGPFTILGKVTQDTYLVDMSECQKRHRMVHVEALKKWFEPTLPVHHIRCVADRSHDLPDYHPNPQDEKPSIDESLTEKQKQQLLVRIVSGS